ncbi:hypothetical protein ACHRVK_22095 [Flavobacterium plurextorum]|uniref:ExsA-like N-terminal regulatory domain-containing protein n=1 Tax=Flavobacterium oncorhynchi TaxID=728056 RepID=A0A226HIF6_9FLAO|nr:hypothetical protein [Flavobacterium oncorhynchi]OXA93884.1 hypothetical protein B0A75_20100 [Flavobacterium oncorhynchi]
MNILDLPNDFLIDTKSSIHVYVYSISKDCLKSKISLNTNVFSFLIEGSKELINKNHFARLNNEQFVIIPSGNCLMSEKLSSNQSYKSVLFFLQMMILLISWIKINLY